MYLSPGRRHSGGKLSSDVPTFFTVKILLTEKVTTAGLDKGFRFCLVFERGRECTTEEKNLPPLIGLEAN